MHQPDLGKKCADAAETIGSAATYGVHCIARNGELGFLRHSLWVDCRKNPPRLASREWFKPVSRRWHPRIVLRTARRPRPEDVPCRHFAALLLGSLLLFAHLGFAASVPVQHKEGTVHGFLVLRTLQGKPIADGDLTQSISGDEITNNLRFRFRDGSLHDETAVFSQQGDFRLLRYHLVQKGPSFQHPIEVRIETAQGLVTVRHADGGSQEEEKSDRLELPPDVSNGLVLTLLKNIRPDAAETKVSMVAITPKPRIVRLAISSRGKERFSVAGSSRRAEHFVVKVEIPGAAGLVAGVLGKQPPDIHVWILDGKVPAFVKSEGPLYLGGPIWRIELASPVWPQTPGSDSKNGS